MHLRVLQKHVNQQQTCIKLLGLNFYLDTNFRGRLLPVVYRD